MVPYSIFETETAQASTTLAFFHLIAVLQRREAATPDRIEGDDAGGVPKMTSASDEYREECKRSGGIIAAESRAAAIMREAATPAVRRAQREDGGYVKKDSPTARLAASEAKAKRPRTTEKGAPSP